MCKSAANRTSILTVNINGFYSWTCYNRSQYDIVNSPETRESGIGKQFALSRDVCPMCQMRCVSTPRLGRASTLPSFLPSASATYTKSAIAEAIINYVDIYYIGQQFLERYKLNNFLT